MKEGLIAFFAYNGAGHVSAPLDLMAVDPATGASRVVVEDAVSSNSCGYGLSWSPDGNRIAYATGSELWLVEVESGKKRKVADVCASSIDWSPTGEWIAMQMQAGTFANIGLVRPDGTGFRFLRPNEKEIGGFRPTFSPDGKTVAIVTPRAGTGPTDLQGWGVYAFSVADGALVGRYADSQRRTVAGGSGGDYLGNSMDWRPDGSSILIGLSESVPGSKCAPLGQEATYQDASLWTVLAAPESALERVGRTGGQFDLREREGTWSPTGSRIAFKAMRATACANGGEKLDATEPIYTMGAGGSDVKKLFTDALATVDLDWQACGPATKVCSIVAAGSGGSVGPVSGSVVSGSVSVQVGGGAVVPLQAGQPLPVGAVVDATAGAVRVEGSGGKSAVFSRGAFRVVSKGAVSELALVGGDFSVCRKRKPSAAGASRPPTVVRRLWGDGKGRFRTRGRYAAATVRGTAWVVEDACEGTVVRVRRGVVEVRASKTGKVTLVRAGASVTIPA